MTRSQNDPLVVPHVPITDTNVCPNDDPLDPFMFEASGALKAQQTVIQMQTVLKAT